jgi:hypothetical protein
MTDPCVRSCIRSAHRIRAALAGRKRADVVDRDGRDRVERFPREERLMPVMRTFGNVSSREKTSSLMMWLERSSKKICSSSS